MYGSTRSEEGGRGPSGWLLSGDVPPNSRRFFRLALIGGLVILFLMTVSFFRTVYTDWLWFISVDYLDVYTTILGTRIWLFLVGFVVSGVALGANYWWAYRNVWGPTTLPFTPMAYVWLRRALILGAVGLGFIICLSFASSLAGRWDVFLKFANATEFGRVDPQFGRDVGFYMFTVPVLHTAQGWLMGAGIAVLITTTALYALIFSMRGLNPVVTPQIRTHAALVGAFLLVTFAAGHYLDTFETLLSPGGAVVGATFTDVTARLPALYLLTAVALIAAGIMLASLRVANLRQAVRLIVAGFGLWVTAGIIAGLVWPGLVQRLVVTPSELERERPFIERNISETRFGFDLDLVDEQPYDVSDTTLAADIAANPETIRNIRLWDPRPLADVYNQVQHIRLQYQFLDVDVDRYTIDGQYRQVLLGTREIFQDGLDASAQRWVNRSLVYTHGYGVAMSSATDFTPTGQPVFHLANIPPEGALEVRQPRVYYGESFGFDANAATPPGVAALPATASGVVTDDVVIVNTTEAEFDHPAVDGATQPAYVDRYDGDGGVPLSSFFRKVMYAWEFGDVNIFLSGQLTPDSKILYRRAIRNRVRTVAPFLRLDRDPYMVVSEGKLYWMLDAYTVSDRLPYSRPITTADVTSSDFRTRSIPFDGFNYIRNSVKVVVDAYDGSMNFYTIEPHRPDPVLAVYRGMFPNLFQPIGEMPEGIREHIRYPESLFLAQSITFLQYHMTDPKEFFLKEDQWQIPKEVVLEGGLGAGGAAQTTSTERDVEPYYVIMKLPGEEAGEFVLIMPFTPKEKPNLIGWMAARSDGDRYGELLVFAFPRDRLFNGPSQIEARIDNDPFISEQFTLWGQTGSKVVRGNLLVIPIGQSLLYAEPIYLQADTLAFPELKRVILATADRVVMEPTLDDAVIALLGGRRVARPTGGEPVPGGIPAEELDRVVDALKKALDGFKTGVDSLDQTFETLQELTGRQ